MAIVLYLGMAVYRMSLSVYTIKERKHFVQILGSPKFSVMSTSEVKKEIEDSITKEQAPQSAKEHRFDNVDKVAPSMCPKCESNMVKVLREDIDGTLVTIAQCKKCQFSRIIK